MGLSSQGSQGDTVELRHRDSDKNGSSGEQVELTVTSANILVTQIPACSSTKQKSHPAAGI